MTVFTETTLYLYCKKAKVTAGGYANRVPHRVNSFANNVPKAFEAYNIQGNNYFKLRDLAHVLNGTTKQFNVGYDNTTKAITIVTGQPYIPAESEIKRRKPSTLTRTPFSWA